VPTRILIVDDDATIRRLIRRLLEAEEGWLVCGEASNGADAVAKSENLHPDLIVMDLAMPNMNGLEAARQISYAQPCIRMLLLTVQQLSTQLAQEARKVGFRAAVSKNTGAEVIHAVGALLQGQVYFPVDDSHAA